MDTETDEDLMLRVGASDMDAWRTLHGRWNQRLFDFLVRRAGAREEAEDALQETWLRVWRFRRSFRGERSFRPWVYTIAVHAGLDARRPEPAIFRFDGPHRDQHELRDRLVQVLHALDPLDRRIVLLATEGFTSEEMAEILGSTAMAVRARLSRSRADLRERMGGWDA